MIRQATTVSSFIIACQRTQETKMGCGECVLRFVRKAFLHNLFLGWWSVRGIVYTALALLQILPASLRKSPARERDRLSRHFHERNVDIREYETDPEGFTRRTRRLTEVMAFVLNRAIHADDRVDGSEVELGQNVLARTSEGALSRADALGWLTAPKGVEERTLDEIDFDQRIGLLRMAVVVTLGDGVLQAQERDFLRRLTSLLDIPEDFLDVVVGRLCSGDGEVADLPSMLARSTLQVGASAGPEDLRAAFQDLIVRVQAASTAPGDDHRLVPSKNRAHWAYRTLTRHVAAEDSTQGVPA